jgi:Zinc knuckle
MWPWRLCPCDIMVVRRVACCVICKQPGHFARECPMKASGGHQYNNGFNDKQQQYRQHQGHTHNNQQSQGMHRNTGNVQQSATGGGVTHGYGNVNKCDSRRL